MKIVAFLFSLILSTAWAIRSKISFHPVNDYHVAQAPCQVELPTMGEMERFLIEASQKTPKIDENFRGFELRNEGQMMVESFKRLLTRYKNSFEYLKPEDDQPRLDRERNHSLECDDVLCKTRKIFGHEEGTKLLYLLLKYGLNLSPYIEKDTRPFDNKHIDLIHRAILWYPEGTFPILENMAIIPSKKVVKHTNGVPFKGEHYFLKLWLYPRWSEKKYSDISKEETVFHELAHYIDFHKNVSRLDEWKQASGGWQKWMAGGKNKYRPYDSKPFVSQYARWSPLEDLAESVSAYRFYPELLKEQSEIKYDLIREHIFGGIEYNQERDCQNRDLLVEGGAQEEEIIDPIIEPIPNKMETRPDEPTLEPTGQLEVPEVIERPEIKVKKPWWKRFF